MSLMKFFYTEIFQIYGMCWTFKLHDEQQTHVYLPYHVSWHLFKPNVYNSNLSSVLICWWRSLHVLNKYSVNDLRHFIHCGMIDHTSLIYSDRNCCHFIVHGIVDHTSLIVHKALLSTCIEVSVSLSCLFVMNHCTKLQSCVIILFLLRFFVHGHHPVLHVRVGFTQAHPNYINC